MYGQVRAGAKKQKARYLEEPLGEEVHKDELFRLCENVLENCTIQRIRYTATDILAMLYVNNGLIDKAKAMCEQFPESIYDTVSELYEQVYCRCDEKKFIEYIKKICALRPNTL